MKINEIVYGCQEHHSSLNLFSRIEKITTSPCGNYYKVTGECCVHGTRFTKEYCNRCLK